MTKNRISRHYSLNGAKPESHTRGNKLKLSTMKNFLLILVCLIGFEMGSNAQNATGNISSCGLLVACDDYKKILTYSEAVDNCPAGYRLPTIEELECMAKNKSTLKLSFWGEYWSITTTGEKALSITMDDRKREKCEKFEKKRVRYIKDTNYQSDDTSEEIYQDCQSTINQSGENYALIYLYRPAMAMGFAASYNIDVEDEKTFGNAKTAEEKSLKLQKSLQLRYMQKQKHMLFLHLM